MKPRKPRPGGSKPGARKAQQAQHHARPSRGEVDVTAAYLAGLPVDQVDSAQADTPDHAGDKSKKTTRETVGMRIIGGKHRGRSLTYSGDLRTRPMKDRVREAVFNLIGTDVEQALIIDLFAGTGALALEALSRGAHHAIMIERHHPTTNLIKDNLKTLGLTEQAEVVFGDAFRFTKKFDPDPTNPKYLRRWVVFCAPPYDFYVSREEEMMELLILWQTRLPEGSLLVVESDDRSAELELPILEEIDAEWESRSYPPAIISILEVPGTAEESIAE